MNTSELRARIELKLAENGDPRLPDEQVGRMVREAVRRMIDGAESLTEEEREILVLDVAFHIAFHRGQAGDYIYKGDKIRLWARDLTVLRAERIGAAHNEALMIVQVGPMVGDIGLQIDGADVHISEILKHPTIGNALGLRSK